MSVNNKRATVSNQDMFTEAQSDYMIVAGSLCLLIASLFVGLTYFVRRCMRTVVMLTTSQNGMETSDEKEDKSKITAEESA